MAASSFDLLVSIARRRLEDAAARGEELHAFAEIFWKDAGETKPFSDNWHLHMLAQALEAQARFEIRDLVINVPPSTGKTLWCQVFWPAWIWARLDAGRRFFFTSYDRGKIHETARTFLRVIRSPLYTALFPHVRCSRPNPAEEMIETVGGGRRIAFQMGGGVTSKHADHIGCDDPNKADATTLEFEQTFETWTKVFPTRVANPDRYTKTIIMQRLNHDDIAGIMLRPPYNYEHVCFPMRYVPNCPWDYGCSLGKLDMRERPGELLWPGRYSEDAVTRIETGMASTQVASAQMQQNPVPETGSYFEDAWLGTWSALPVLVACDIVQTWDLGFKGRTGTRQNASADSWVHGALWAEYRGLYYLLDEVRGHWNYPETKRRFISAQSRVNWNRAGAILIENKANGIALTDELKEMLGNLYTPIVEVEPHGSKEERAKRHSGRVSDGRLLLPPAAVMPTVGEFRAELVRFPHQKVNDRVDTTTQMLDYFTEPGRNNAALLAAVAANM